MTVAAGRTYFGLDALDREIARYVTAQEGFFVELGANDGVTQNNSLYFERLGWRGLLIEPVPSLCDQCLTNRPDAIVVNCACVEDTSITQIEMTYVDLMSVIKRAKSPHDECEWIERGERVQGISAYDLVVPAKTLFSVIREQQIDHVDLLILDVEGYEKQVLRGLDLDRCKPRFVVVEESYGENVADVLKKHYNFVAELSKRQHTHDLLFQLKD